MTGENPKINPPSAIPALQEHELEPTADFNILSTILQEQDIAAALLSVGAVADRDMVCKTQRRVRELSIGMSEHRQRARHAIGLAILGFSLLLLMLTPVLWGGFHLADGWRTFTDCDTQSMYMIGWLFPVTLVGVVLACIRLRTVRGARRIDHRVGSRLGSLVR